MSNLFLDDGPKANRGERKVMLATTAYDNPDASYTFSIQRSRQALADKHIKTAYCLLQGNCHVDDARNSVIQEFLLSDCSALVFLDADVSWRPGALVKLCEYDADIVGGVYPFRREGSASRRGMPVRMIEGITEADEYGLMEVEGLPAGFMKISREVLESLNVDADKYWNRDDTRMKVPILFERCYDKDTGARWGGDLNFCRKARARGFKVYAIPEMELGHTAKTIIKDTLGAALRRQAGTTLAHVCREVREGRETLQLVSEAMRFVDNPYGALEDVLMPCIVKARQSDGPILETGSGLTTILMAAANPDQTVFCIEHDQLYAHKLKELAFLSGVSNIAICSAPIVDGWYDLKELEGLPDHFGLGLCDGPPRTLASRMGFFEHYADKCATIIVDDIEDAGYLKALREWCADKYEIDIIEPRAAILTATGVAV